MRLDIDTKSKFLAGGIETTEGQRAASMSLVRSRNLEVVPYEGNTVQREYAGTDGRYQPKIKTNRHTTASFDTDFAGAGDSAVIPGADAFLRMAGLSRVAADASDASKGYQYLISDAADVDSGSLLMNRKAGRTAGGVRYMRYEMLGVRGYVGLTMKKGQDPLFQFRDFKGSYIRPVQAEEADEIVIEYNAQEYPEVFENGNVPLFQFGIPNAAAANGVEMRDICLHEFDVPNYSGFTVSRVNAINCARTRQSGVPIDFTAQIGYDDSFWELVESHKNIITVPFAMRHGTSNGNMLSIEAQQIQIHDLKEVDIEGEVGMSLSGTFLDKPVLTIA